MFSCYSTVTKGYQLAGNIFNIFCTHYLVIFLFICFNIYTSYIMPKYIDFYNARALLAPEIEENMYSYSTNTVGNTFQC
jgi:hypothetical protein